MAQAIVKIPKLKEVHDVIATIVRQMKLQGNDPKITGWASDRSIFFKIDDTTVIHLNFQGDVSGEFAMTLEDFEQINDAVKGSRNTTILVTITNHCLVVLG